jgi:hypothetical protein
MRCRHILAEHMGASVLRCAGMAVLWGARLERQATAMMATMFLVTDARLTASSSVGMCAPGETSLMRTHA